MFSLSFYKVFHLFGVLLLFTSLGALAGARPADGDGPAQRLARIAHGIALLLILVAGFGLIARQGFTGGWPLWVWLKLLIWPTLGAAVVLIRRAGAARRWLVLLLPVLGAIAAWLAIYRVGG